MTTREALEAEAKSLTLARLKLVTAKLKASNAEIGALLGLAPAEPPG